MKKIEKIQERALCFIYEDYENLLKKSKLQSYLKIRRLKAYRLSELNIFFIFKVANIRCFILIAVEIFHNIIRK